MAFTDGLDTLCPGEPAVVEQLMTQGAMRRRLLDLGLAPGAQVRALFRGGGGISAYLIRGAVIALRREDAETVMVKRFCSRV